MDQKFKVKYNGFVYIDQPAGGIPDRSSIEKAAKLLRKRKKTAQSIHPLFARGLDTRLDLERPGKGKFKCHSFELSSSALAHDLAFETACICNQTFRKVRRSVRHLRKKKIIETGLDSPAKDLSTISQLAGHDANAASKMKDAIQRTDSHSSEDEEQINPPDEPTWSDFNHSLSVDFIDGMSDQLAELLIGEQPRDVQQSDFTLDNDVFSFGEIIGEATC
eukprot:gene9897-10422_t